MSEESLVKRTPAPVTREKIAADLKQLGLQENDIVLVHSAISKIGWVAGGPVAVVQALMDVVTPQGTLVMPTHTSDNSDPANWENPPVPESWWEPIRQHMPAYHPDITPTRQMGRIVDCFRSFPNVQRSDHPQSSFAAWGRYAEAITTDHKPEHDLGEGSPLAHLYDKDGKVLLLGVGHERNTSLHLAEYRSDYPGKTTEQNGAAMFVQGERQWVWFETLVLGGDDFADVGAVFETSIGYKPGKIGLAESRLLPQPALVDFAVEWFSENRTAS